MTSHKDRTRRLARRARRRGEREAEERAAEEVRANPSPINHSRLFQIFSSLSFRSNVRGGTRPFANYVLGPLVEAKTSEELVEKTDDLYVGAALAEPEN